MYDESKYLQVRGTAVVVTGGFSTKTTVSWQPERTTGGGFTHVPPNKRLIITDFVYIPEEDVTSKHVINVAETNAGADIILQLFVDPNVHTQAHFLTGFVIAPGETVSAWSDAGSPAGQHVSITLVGYLAHPFA